MLIDLTNPDGSTRTIESKTIFRFRGSLGTESGVTTVDASSGRIYVQDTVDTVKGLLGADAKLIELHAPSGQSVVFLDAAKVTDIQGTNTGAPPGAQALIIISGKRQYVAETRQDVRDAVNGALA